MTKALAPLVYVVMIICAALAHIYYVSGPPVGVPCEDEEGGGWTYSLPHAYFHVLEKPWHLAVITIGLLRLVHIAVAAPGYSASTMTTFAGSLSRISAVLVSFVGVGTFEYGQV